MSEVSHDDGAAYPPIRSFGSFPQELAAELSAVVRSKEPSLAALRNAKNVQSRDVMSILRAGLEKLGFEPYRLFQVGGGKSYQVDAFSSQHGVAVEVEKGRVILGNQLYLDLFKFHVISNVRHGAVILPTVSREETEQPFVTGCGICELLYRVPQARLAFEGLLLIGY